MIDQTGMAPTTMRIVGGLGRLFQRVNLTRKLAFRLAKNIRILMVAPVYWRRRTLSRKLIEASSHRLSIDTTRGFAFLEPDSIAESPAMIAACRSIHARFERTARETDQYLKKPFFLNILERRDLSAYPELLNYAMCDPIVEAVSTYLDAMPLLRSIGIYVSQRNETTARSQMFHCDYDDLRQIKCFINVYDLDDDGGPFTFLPADVTHRVRRQLSHDWRGGRLSDEAVLAHCRCEDIVRLSGPAGGGGMVDTSSCLHYGSRTRQGRRVVFMFQYVTYPNIGVAQSTKFDEKGQGLYFLPADLVSHDPTRRPLLSP